MSSARVEVIRWETCPRCKGSGRVSETRTSPGGVFILNGGCPDCNETGRRKTVLATLPDRATLERHVLDILTVSCNRQNPTDGAKLIMALFGFGLGVETSNG